MKTHRGIAIPVKATIPVTTDVPRPFDANLPKTVSGIKRTVIAAAKPTRAKTFFSALSIPLARPRTAANANNGIAIAASAKDALKALSTSTFIPLRILRTTDIASIKTDKDMAA